MSLKTPKKFLIIPGREPAAKEIRRLHWRLPVHTNAINILLQTSPPWGAYWKTSAFSARKHQLRLDSSRFRKKISVFENTRLHTNGVLRPAQTDATLLASNTQYCWAQHVASVCMEPQQCWYLLRIV